MRSKVYISGKITGIENEAPKLFQDAEAYLKTFNFNVVNPMKLEHNHDKTWQSYMKEDLKAMLDCNLVFMLKNWQESRGAVIEHNVAIAMGIPIKYEVFYEAPKR